MSGGKIIVLASKDEIRSKEYQSSGSPQSVLLIPNNPSSNLREDSITDDNCQRENDVYPPFPAEREKRIRRIRRKKPRLQTGFKLWPLLYNGSSTGLNNRDSAKRKICVLKKLKNSSLAFVEEVEDKNPLLILCKDSSCIKKPPPLRIKTVDELKDGDKRVNVVSLRASCFVSTELQEEKSDENFTDDEGSKRLGSLEEVTVKEEILCRDAYNEAQVDPLLNQKISSSEAFRSNNGIRSESVSSKKIPCDFCNGAFKSSSLADHIKKHHSLRQSHMIKCEKCDKSFKSAENLRNHLIRSHLTCSICAKNCKTFEDLDKHHKLCHSCSICKKLFISKEKVEQHQEEIHRICHICFKELPTHVELQIHQQKTHPRCQICNLTMKSLESLQKHREIHFKCHDCDVFFKSTQDKRQHFSIYHSCFYCKKAFEKIEHLEVHKIAHRTCAICRLEFKTISEQLNHQKACHFKCYICSITFRRIEDFNQHREQAHKAPPKRKVP